MSDSMIALVLSVVLAVLVGLLSWALISGEAPAREVCEKAGNVWLQRDGVCVGAPK